MNILRLAVLTLLAIPSLPAPGQEEKFPIEPAPVTTPEPAEGHSGASTDPAPFTFEQLRFDPTNNLRDKKDSSGAIFLSYRPGNIWFGERPTFVSPEIVIGGEDLYSCTDIYEHGKLIYAHYGRDHYRTRWISVIDETRREILRVDALEFGNISRAIYDTKDGTLYFTVVEGNNNGAAKACLHAWSVEESKPLWRSDAGTAHGNFLVYDAHILTHYGFTGEDDFVCAIDKATGKTLEKKKIATAADWLIREGDEVIAPCYEGVVTFSFREE